MSGAAPPDAHDDIARLARRRERLRLFLEDLPLSARQKLGQALGEARLSGAMFPGADLILDAMPSLIPALDADTGRAPALRDIVFAPIEPFLVEAPLAVKTPGRIPVAAADAVWTWLGRDVMAREFAGLQDALNAMRDSGDADRVKARAQALLPSVIKAIDAALDRAETREKERKRLASLLGDESVIDELADIRLILAAAPAVAAAAASLPARIGNLDGEGLANIIAAIDRARLERPHIVPHLLVLLMSRLVHPMQLVRIPIQSIGSDDPLRLLSSHYHHAVDIVLSELELQAFVAVQVLRERRFDDLCGRLRVFHDQVRALRTDLDMSGEGRWQKRLGRIRADLSRHLAGAIEPLRGELRRMLRPRLAGEPTLAPPAEVDIADVVGRLELLVICRTLSAELALNELTTRLMPEVHHCLDQSFDVLLDSLRAAPDSDRGLKLAKLAAAVRFSAAVFGQSHAQIMAKAVDVAKGPA